MSDILCVTNRTLCAEDFLTRIGRIASARPAGIILREKDLSEADYERLARQVADICRKYKIPCILHGFPGAANRLGAKAIHLPLPDLRRLNETERARFSVIGASCHSTEEAVEAEQLGCTYLTAGHIFATNCKKDLAPRGISFLRQVCASVSLPVFAIGGICAANYPSVLRAGAKGACVMSGLMQCRDVSGFLKDFKH